MDSMLPNSKLVILKNSGHVPMEENPKESLEFLKSFLNESS
jgi:pimeloyl-ACP methyl ester carboxylesterase